ncbi:MAG: type II secretion system protein [Clostridium sp.]|nr:type II secretion system protein [Clostridium sp.]
MKKNGFTLIELLAVIGIVAVLSIIAVPSILKLYNDSLENSFKTESLAVLKSLDDDLSIDYNNIGEYDCTVGNEKIYKKCTITIENGKPILNAEGTGKYSNFLISDETLGGNGNIISIGKLENYTEENIVTHYSLIDKENGKLSDKMTEQKFSDIAKTIKEVPELKNKFTELYAIFSGDFSNIELSEDSNAFYITNSAYISDGKLYGGKSNIFDEDITVNENGVSEISVPVFISSFDVPNKDGGTYQIESQGLDGYYSFMIISKNKIIEKLKEIENENELNNEIENIIASSFVPSNDNGGHISNYIFGNYEISNERYDISNPIVTLDGNETYYLVVVLSGFDRNNTKASVINQISMTKINNIGIKLKGDKKILLLPSEVKKYNDMGISGNGKLKENKNYVVFNNLKKEIGDYNYTYVYKQNDLVNTLKRNIYVVSEKYTDSLKFVNNVFYLEKNTDKYKFYCSVSDSYMDANNNYCDFSCNNFGYVRVESTETSFVKNYVPIPRICSPQ